MKTKHDPRQNRFSVVSSIVLFFILAFSLATPQSAYAQGNTVGGTTWYVATTGNDGNSCTAVGSPCLTINGAIDKAVDGDTIKVAIGTYTGTGDVVVSLFNKSVNLSGGWNTSFTMQNGMSVIDGQNTRKGISVYWNSTSNTIDRFIVQNSFSIANQGGGGIYNAGVLTMNNSA